MSRPLAEGLIPFSELSLRVKVLPPKPGQQPRWKGEGRVSAGISFEFTIQVLDKDGVEVELTESESIPYVQLLRRLLDAIEFPANFTEPQPPSP